MGNDSLMIENIFGFLGLLVDTKVRRSTVFSFSILERSVCYGMFLAFSMPFLITLIG